MEKITFVLTSCGRFDLLEKTLDSFFKFNNYSIDQYLLIDDSGNKDIQNKIKLKYQDRFEFIFNEQRIGQINSIDKIYNKIKNEYIFHCEDDWEFYRSDFIKESIELLNFDSKIINVWLRDLNEISGMSWRMNSINITI